jgi:hypothetical protein
MEGSDKGDSESMLVRISGAIGFESVWKVDRLEEGMSV